MEKEIDYEAWADELQNSKPDLIDLLQSHIDLVEENKRLNEKLENAIFTDIVYSPKSKNTFDL